MKELLGLVMIAAMGFCVYQIDILREKTKDYSKVIKKLETRLDCVDINNAITGLQNELDREKKRLKTLNDIPTAQLNKTLIDEAKKLESAITSKNNQIRSSKDKLQRIPCK